MGLAKYPVNLWPIYRQAEIKQKRMKTQQFRQTPKSQEINRYFRFCYENPLK